MFLNINPIPKQDLVSILHVQDLQKYKKMRYKNLYKTQKLFYGYPRSIF